ncbi:hypothetical protein GGI12_005912 [Dipsacomyces acuminosporus]|nr:hypothetical protein GGI12_005912 [Dipsacomyces acuminosporus]
MSKAAKAANPKKPMDDLNGLTSDPTEELTPADQLMEQLYGKVTSSLYEYAGDVEVGSEAPNQWSEGSANQALDAVSVYQNSTQWTQERAFIISEK